MRDRLSHIIRSVIGDIGLNDIYREVYNIDIHNMDLTKSVYWLYLEEWNIKILIENQSKFYGLEYDDILEYNGPYFLTRYTFYEI